MKKTKIILRKFVVPSLLLTAGITSSIVLATKNDIQKGLIVKANTNNATTKMSSKLSESTIREDFRSYQATTPTSINNKLKYNAQMLYVQFGNFLSNNLNKGTTDINSLTFNGNDRDVKSIIKTVASEAAQSVWSANNWSTNQPSGNIGPGYKKDAYWIETELSDLKDLAKENYGGAIATGGAPAIKFTTKAKGGGSAERILTSINGFDNTPYKSLGEVNKVEHHNNSPIRPHSWYTANLKILGGKLQNNSLFGESLKNNNSRVVNFFSTKNNATNEVSSSNYVTTANTSWLNGKGVIYPFQSDTSTGWYKNTSMTTRNIGDYQTWATNYLDSYVDQFETTNTTTKFGSSNSVQTATFKVGKIQSQVLKADNVSAYFRMYVNTNNQQDLTSVDGKAINYWYSNNLISDNDATRVMSGNTTYLGNTDAVETIQNINYDLASLIQVDSNSSTYLDASGRVYTSIAPTMKFTWNINLFTALKEAKQIADLVKTIESDTNLTQAQLNKFNTEVYPALQQGLCDYNTLKDYYEQVKSNSVANPIFSKLSTEAEYWTTINKFNWNLPITTSSANLAKTIQSWGDAYSIILPKIFTNDISVEMKATGSDQTQRITIYSATDRTWKTITTPNYGQQQKTFNNNVTLTFDNFKLSNSTTGENVSSQGLNASNVLKNTEVTNKQNIKLDQNNDLAVTFAYNPSLNGLIQSPSAGYSLASLNLYALYETGYYTSDLLDNLLEYRDTFASETAKQLKIPPSLVSSLANGITFDKARSFVAPSIDEVKPSILETTQASDLKKFITLSDDYSNKYRIWNSDSTNTAKTESMLAAKKELDNLGYYYLTVYSSIPIDYYSTKESYEELQKDKTFVNIGQNTGTGYYGYYVKYAATNKPLNIDNLSNYLNITKSINTTTSNSDINEIKTINDVKTKLDSLNTQLEDTTSKLNSLLQTSTTLQNDIDTLNKQIDSLLSDLVNDNPELSQAAKEVDAKYQTQINACTQNINLKKEEFDKNNDFKGSGFIKHLNKTLDYTTELKDLTNIYENKLNDLGTLFTNSEPVIKVQKQIQTLTSNVLTKVNNVTSEINSLTKELSSLSDLNTTLTTQLANINKLTYTTTTKNTTKLAVNFALPAMQTAASLSNSINNEITSYYSLLSENKLSDYFYVTKAQFAAKLNEIIKTQTGIDPKITADTITYQNGGVTIDSNNYNYAFTKNNDTLNTLVFNIELNDIKTTIHEVNVNNPKVKESDLILNRSETNATSSNDATTLLNNIATYKVTLQKNQTSILNNINKLSSNLSDLTKKASDINEYNNSASLYPDYIQTQSTLNKVKDELTNYKPTTISESKLNFGLIGAIVAAGIVLLAILIGTTIRIKSKRRIKTKQPTSNDADVIEKFIKTQEEEKAKEKGF